MALAERSDVATVPIYNAILWIIVTNDLKKSINRDDRLGFFNIDRMEDAACEGVDAWTIRSNGKFALMFNRSKLTRSTVAHEVYHLTQFIGRWVGLKLKGDCEHMAYLNGYLTEQVYQLMKKWNEKIK